VDKDISVSSGTSNYASIPLSNNRLYSLEATSLVHYHSYKDLSGEHFPLVFFPCPLSNITTNFFINYSAKFYIVYYILSVCFLIAAISPCKYSTLWINSSIPAYISEIVFNVSSLCCERDYVELSSLVVKFKKCVLNHSEAFFHHKANLCVVIIESILWTIMINLLLNNTIYHQFADLQLYALLKL
jgi:hypothetical protein